MKNVEKINPKIPQNLKQTHFIYLYAETVHEKEILMDFVGWNALPKEEREPKTMGEFAKKYGVHRDTLSHWRNLIGFWDEVRMFRKHFFRKYTTDIMYALVKAARKGNPKATELFVKLMEDFDGKETLRRYSPAWVLSLPEEQIEQLNWAAENLYMADGISDTEFNS